MECYCIGNLIRFQITKELLNVLIIECQIKLPWCISIFFLIEFQLMMSISDDCTFLSLDQYINHFFMYSYGLGKNCNMRLLYMILEVH